MAINTAWIDVRDFHKTFGHPAPSLPQMQPAERADARGKWIESEVAELREAATLAEQADAYIDIAYFAIGGLVELGVVPHRLWCLVHEANMAKRHPDGTVKRREDGKIIKPEGWVAPDKAIAEEIARQSVS